MERFIVVSSLDAIRQKYPGWEEFAKSTAQYHDYFWCLYETDGEKPVRFVERDGGEPEDQLLVRDWRWVPEELNKLAEENARLRQKLDAIIEGE